MVDIFIHFQALNLISPYFVLSIYFDNISALIHVITWPQMGDIAWIKPVLYAR